MGISENSCGKLHTTVYSRICITDADPVHVNKTNTDMLFNVKKTNDMLLLILQKSKGTLSLKVKFEFFSVGVLIFDGEPVFIVSVCIMLCQTVYKVYRITFRVPETYKSIMLKVCNNCCLSIFQWRLSRY